MSASDTFFPFAATAVTGFALVTALFLSTEVIAAEPHETAGKVAANQPGSAKSGAAKAQSLHKSARASSPTTTKQAPVTPAPQNEPRSGSACTCPNDSARPSLWPRPKYADLKPEFTPSDEIATLENLQLALSETSDGGTYVWHSHKGWLNGVVQPTTSFKDSGGRICRHIHIMLTSGTNSSKTEGIACRLPTGQWQLEG